MALFTDAELKLSDYVFLAVCFVGSILIRKRALFISYVFRYFYSGKSIANELIENSIVNIELDDDGLTQEGEKKVSWGEVAGIELFEDMVCIVLNPLLYQIYGNFMPPTMFIIPRKAFENTTYDFDKFKTFCENVGNPNSTFTLEH